MYILYLDDSGSVDNQPEDYFVLGGVCTPEKSVRWLSHQLEILAENLSPNNSREVEFHASTIFGGRESPWRDFNREKRIDIIKRVLRVLNQAHSDIVTFACAIHKHSFQSVNPVELCFEELSSRFELYLQRIAAETGKEHKGLIVLDKSSYETNLQSLATTFREKGNRWGSYLKTICEVPLFVDSKAAPITQLADHIAYAVFRRYNAADLNYYNCIEGKFDQSNGIIHGLVHKQTYNRGCTCPACISRNKP